MPGCDCLILRSDGDGPLIAGRSGFIKLGELGVGKRGLLVLAPLNGVPGADRPFVFTRIYVSHFFMNSLLGKSIELAK